MLSDNQTFLKTNKFSEVYALITEVSSEDKSDSDQEMIFGDDELFS